MSANKTTRVVLVHADGRTTASDFVGVAEWHVVGGIYGPDRRYYRLAEVAFTETDQDGGPRDGVAVYVEQPEAEYEAECEARSRR